jgi:regulator of sigma E protease
MTATIEQLSAIGRMIRNRTTEGLGGPVAMATAVTAAAEKGVGEYLTMLMIISVALGFFNLLPVPALDGGRLGFLAYEVITRRRPNERIEAAIHTVGILVLLLVLVAVTYRDIFGTS